MEGLLLKKRQGMDCLELYVSNFASLQISNGRAVGSEAPRCGLCEHQRLPIVEMRNEASVPNANFSSSLCQWPYFASDQCAAPLFLAFRLAICS